MRKQIDALVVYVAAYNIPTINAFANVTGSLDEQKKFAINFIMRSTELL